MKTILLSILLFTSAIAIAQSPNDSAYTKNLSLRATLVAYLTNLTTNPANDSLYTVFIKWRTAQRANFKSGVTTITVDSIPTVDLAHMYNTVLSQPYGFGIGDLFKSQLVSARAANPYLDRLCTGYEQVWLAASTRFIIDGYKLQIGH